MKISILIFVVIGLLFAGCCEFGASDVQFSAEESDLLSVYNIGDTLTFVNTSDSIQTWIVLGTDTTLKTGCFMEGTDHTVALTLTNNQKGEKTHSENHFYLSKYPGGKNGVLMTLSIFFEDFYGSIESEDSLKTTPFNSINLNGITIPNIIEIQSDYMERKSKSTDITQLYWSKKLGLAAFKTYGGEIWIEKRWL
jgi:hypothetical protein